MYVYVSILVNCNRVAIGVSIILSEIHGGLRDYSQACFIEACKIKSEDEHAGVDICEVRPVIIMAILLIDEVDWVFVVDLCVNSIPSRAAGRGILGAEVERIVQRIGCIVFVVYVNFELPLCTIGL